MPRPNALGRSELRILRYISDHHPIRVGEVAEHFASTAGNARTTVLTVMERLRAKGHLTRKKIQGTWHYSPKVPKNDLLRGLVSKFVSESLGGSVTPFVAYLAAEAETLSDDEIAKLTQLVRELKAQVRERKA